jgi:hypothetical protein
MNQQQLIDILGWIGTVLFLIAYYLVSVKKVEGDSNIYQGMNILASSLLVINTFYLRAYPSLALNAIWIVIGLIALMRRRSSG